MLHNQIDGLFSAVEQRVAALEDATAASNPLPRAAVDDGMGFKIAIIGDSTIRVRRSSLELLALGDKLPGTMVGYVLQ